MLRTPLPTRWHYTPVVIPTEAQRELEGPAVPFQSSRRSASTNYGTTSVALAKLNWWIAIHVWA